MVLQYKNFTLLFIIRFRGVREGGITDNSSYYLFTHGEDNIINAFKLEEWYNFQPVQRYKTLTVEEAEEEFGRFVLMISLIQI